MPPTTAVPMSVNGIERRLRRTRVADQSGQPTGRRSNPAGPNLMSNPAHTEPHTAANGPARGRKLGYPVALPASRSILAAMMKSFSCKPLIFLVWRFTFA
jgi:hypothetical protein